MSTQTKKTTAPPKQPASSQQKTPEQPIPQREIKQNAGVSASMALQAAQKAWELRQAAHGAVDAKAREEILAKAINKEIEAESFGKAAKYTRSGAFQGLAAGAGLGVRPGVTLGKVTGAIVGGTVATVTGLLGGGVGSVYGAMNGPMWDLGEMAAHGVQGVVGDWLPDWAATSSQKKALEKMVMQTKETQAPTKEELEEMKAEAPDEMPHEWYADMRSYVPSMPKMPKMPNMPNMSGAGAALGLGGVGSMFGGQKKAPVQDTSSNAVQNPKPTTSTPQTRAKSKQTSDSNTTPTPKEAPKPKTAPTPKEAPSMKESAKSPQAKQPEAKIADVKTTSDSQPKTKAAPAKKTPAPVKKSPTTAQKTATQSPSSNSISSAQPKRQSADTNKGPVANGAERKKPRKLESKPEASKSNGAVSKTPAKKAPRKLESRSASAVKT